MPAAASVVHRVRHRPGPAARVGVAAPRARVEVGREVLRAAAALGAAAVWGALLLLLGG